VFDVAVERDIGDLWGGGVFLESHGLGRVKGILPPSMSKGKRATFMIGGQNNHKRSKHDLASWSVDLGLEERTRTLREDM